MHGGSCVRTLALVGALALPGSPSWAQSYDPRPQRAPLSADVFYDGIAPYGDWLELPDYGWSWAPRVDRDWRPYTRGQWIMTDDGWFWDSDEPFGWATYHYGRWVDEPSYGWIWIPGTEWAPAWVSWRHGDGYTGWAPLPPRATWQTHVGLRIGGLDLDAFIGGRDYTFVQDAAFMDRGVYQRVLPWTRNAGIIERTSNVTRYGYANQRVVDTGLTVSDVEQAIGRSVPRARTIDIERVDAPRPTTQGEVAVFRPEVRVAPGQRPAQGRSVVRGEAPPPLLVQRVRERDAAQQRPVAEPRGQQVDPRNQRDAAQQQAEQDAAQRQVRQAAQQQAAQQQAAQQQAAQQQAAQQQAQQQARQRADREKVQANDQQQRNQRDAAQQQAQQAAQQQAQQQAQQRADREKAQANDPQQRNQHQAAQPPAQQQVQPPADRKTPQASDTKPPAPQQAQPAKVGGNAQAADGRHGKDAPPLAKGDPKDKGKGKDKDRDKKPPSEGPKP